MNQWKGRRITLADGQQLEALVTGPRNGRPTLLVHGFPDSPRTFDELAPLLSADRLCVAPYLPGYGESDPPVSGSYGSEHLSSPVLGVADALGWGEFDVFGHDWGAVAAYVSASGSRGRVRRMVCAAVPPPGAFLAMGSRQLVRSRYMAWFQLAGIADRDFEAGGLDRLWRRWSPGWKYTSEQRELALDALGNREQIKAALRYYRGAMRAAFLEHSELRLVLDPVSVPTLLIYGTHDGCLGPEVMERSRTEFGGEHELLPVVGAGHFMHREEPHLVAARALEFLDRG